MKIATYNIQNLFNRDKRLIKENRLEKQENWNEELEALFTKKIKLEKDYIRMRELAILLGFHKAPFEPYVSLKNLDGNLMVDSSGSVLDNKASEITDWNGWIKLGSIPLTRSSILHKAQVIIDANPNVLFLQEVENRASLIKFNNTFLKNKMSTPFSEIVYMDDNESKGLGMGILLKKGFRITAIRSFTNESDLDDNSLFELNLLRFRITDENYKEIYVISCQLSNESDNKKVEEKRKRQANKIAEIYQKLRNKNNDDIIILGNLNAPCYSTSLAPLLQETDLKDIVKHDSFETDLDLGNHSGYYRMGGYRKGVNIKQKDYLLLSPLLFERVNASGLNRKAVWPPKIPKWPVYESMVSELDAASSFPLIWCNTSG